MKNPAQRSRDALGSAASARGDRVVACEWIFGDRPKTQVVAMLVSAGFHGLHIVGDPDRKDLHQLTKLLERSGLTASGTTAAADRPERDLANPDPDSRREAIRYYKDCVELACNVGAPTIGLVPSAEGRIAAHHSYALEWNLAVEAAREVALYAAERDIAVAVEPLNRYETYLVNRVEQALDFASAVDVPGVGVVADLFHMNIEESDPLDALAASAAALLEVHVADSNRRGLGQGQLRLDDYAHHLASQAFRGVFVVECLPPGSSPFRPDSGSAAARELDQQLALTATAILSLVDVGNIDSSLCALDHSRESADGMDEHVA